MRCSEWSRRAGLLVALVEKLGLLGALKLMIRRYVLRTPDVVEVRVKGVPHPVKLRPGTTDFHAFSQVIALCDYHFGVWQQSSRVNETYEAEVRSGRRPLIVDCGANIGLASIWFACAYPRARIVAVEASRENYDMLVLNARDYPNIKPVLGAIWNSNEDVAIANPGAEPWAFQVRSSPGAPAAGRLRGITIPELFAESGADRALIVKIDIEGGERQLFQSNTGWMSSTDLLILELHDDMVPFQRTSSNFYRCLASMDAEVCMKGENIFVFVAPSRAGERTGTDAGAPAAKQLEPTQPAAG